MSLTDLSPSADKYWFRGINARSFWSTAAASVFLIGIYAITFGPDILDTDIFYTGNLLYSREDISQSLTNLERDGRVRYFLFSLLLDTALPIAYTLAFFRFFEIAFDRALNKWTVILFSMALLVDYGENIQLWFAIQQYPTLGDAQATALAATTLAKWVFVSGTIVFLGAFGGPRLLLRTLRWNRGRKKT